MPDFFISFFNQFPPYIGVFLMAVLPVAERFALSIALFHYHIPLIEAAGIVIVGNMIPVIVILLLGEKFHLWISNHKSVFGAAWIKSVAHAQAKFARYEKYGLIGLLIFLSVPSPLNGAFTAAIIAFILGYPMHKSLPYLFGGIVIGNIFTIMIMLGFVKMF